MKKNKFKKLVLISLSLFILIFILLTFFFLFKSYENYQLGETALKQGNIDLAVSYYDYSIRNYSLINKYSQLSANQLRKIAEDFENKAEYKKATAVYQTLLSALSSVETSYSKNKNEIEFLIEKVQQLRAKIPENEFL